ncbi:hypothetical protein CBS101457_001239 [Exobasidium rhododendri]|nr:hypothetical protein CBS101457_001239 [Exobasidium rhododendri]
MLTFHQLRQFATTLTVCRPAASVADVDGNHSTSLGPRPLRRPKSKPAKESGTVANVFATLSGESLSNSLPARFGALKTSLVTSEDHAIALEKAWKEVLATLQAETEEIIKKGSALIPVIHYPGLDAIQGKNSEDWIGRETMDSILRRGTVIVKGVLPAEEALEYKQVIRDYVVANPQSKGAYVADGFPADDPQVYELYWSKAQLAARSHPSFLKVSELLLSLFHAPSQSQHESDFEAVPPTALSVSLSNPLTYCDRLRIRLPGDSAFALGPHIDGGGIERWEDETFRGVWSSILELNSNGTVDWKSHDSWSLGPLAQRLGANTDMYSGAGACSVFRPLQGWLSMSSTGESEGTLRVLSALQSATAYIILRPLFKAKKSLEDCRGEGAEYLKADNWVFDVSDAHFQGCSLGRNIELNDETHPHLRLSQTMTSIPRVEPGDCAFWHCDVVHAVESQHRGKAGKDSSVLYIPIIPLTMANFDYILSQRESLIEGIPPNDFPGGEGESRHVGRGTARDIVTSAGRRSMGLEKLEIQDGMPEAEKQLLRYCNAHV